MSWLLTCVDLSWKLFFLYLSIDMLYFLFIRFKWIHSIWMPAHWWWHFHEGEHFRKSNKIKRQNIYIWLSHWNVTVTLNSANNRYICIYKRKPLEKELYKYWQMFLEQQQQRKKYNGDTLCKCSSIKSQNSIYPNIYKSKVK